MALRPYQRSIWNLFDIYLSHPRDRQSEATDAARMNLLDRTLSSRDFRRPNDCLTFLPTTQSRAEND